MSGEVRLPVRGCECHVFDIGWRCAACVAACSVLGHPETEERTNGVNCWCGMPEHLRGES